MREAQWRSRMFAFGPNGLIARLPVDVQAGRLDAHLGAAVVLAVEATILGLVDRPEGGTAGLAAAGGRTSSASG
jgi:hypothetical protein